MNKTLIAGIEDGGRLALGGRIMIRSLPLAGALLLTVAAQADQHSRDLIGASLGQGYDDMFRQLGRCTYGSGDRQSGVLNCDTAEGAFQARFAGDAPTVAYSLSLRFCSGEGFIAVEDRVEKKYGMALGMKADKEFEWTRADGLRVAFFGPIKAGEMTYSGASTACTFGDGYTLTISDDSIDLNYRKEKTLRDGVESGFVPTPKF